MGWGWGKVGMSFPKDTVMGSLNLKINNDQGLDFSSLPESNFIDRFILPLPYLW